MRSMKLFQLAVLFVVGVALFTGTPAPAQVPADWGTIELTPTGAEPSARGQATLTGVRLVDYWVSPGGFYSVESYQGELTVTCQGLTPGATYSTPAGKFKADRQGDGTLIGSAGFQCWYELYWDEWGSYFVFSEWSGLQVEVARKYRKSKVLVLSGGFPFGGL